MIGHYWKEAGHNANGDAIKQKCAFCKLERKAERAIIDPDLPSKKRWQYSNGVRSKPFAFWGDNAEFERDNSVGCVISQWLSRFSRIVSDVIGGQSRPAK